MKLIDLDLKSIEPEIFKISQSYMENCPSWYVCVSNLVTMS